MIRGNEVYEIASLRFSETSMEVSDSEFLSGWELSQINSMIA